MSRRFVTVFSSAGTDRIWTPARSSTARRTSFEKKRHHRSSRERRKSIKKEFEQHRCNTIPHERETQRTTAPICVESHIASEIGPHKVFPERLIHCGDDRERHIKTQKASRERSRYTLPESPAKSTPPPPPRRPAASRRARLQYHTLVCFTKSNVLSNFCHVIRKSAHIFHPKRGGFCRRR